MKSRTICYSPGRVAPGMSLAKAVQDRDGNILLAAGTVLELEMIDRLIRRGVETISVLVPDTRDEETIALELQAAQARIDTIFRGTGSPARDMLRAAVTSYRLECIR